MAKVTFLGDPNGREHRDAIEHAGIVLPLGEAVQMPDAAARKLDANPHFKVTDLPALPKVSQPKGGKEDAAASRRIAELEKELADVREQLAERGELLQAATERIAELEAALPPAGGEAAGEQK